MALISTSFAKTLVRTCSPQLFALTCENNLRICVFLILIVSLPALDTYGAIKMINYIRRQVFEHRCTLCGLMFPQDEERLEHMSKVSHLCACACVCVCVWFSFLTF